MDMFAITLAVLEKTYDTIQPLAINIGTVIIIIMSGLILGRLAGKLLTRFLREFELNLILNKTMNIRIDAVKAISLFVSFFIYFTTIVLALQHMGWGSFVLYALIGIVLIMIMVTLLLELRDFMPNIYAGHALTKTLAPGERIRVGSAEGHIQKIGWLNTWLKTDEDDEVMIANKLILKELRNDNSTPSVQDF